MLNVFSLGNLKIKGAVVVPLGGGLTIFHFPDCLIPSECPRFTEGCITLACGVYFPRNGFVVFTSGQGAGASFISPSPCPPCRCRAGHTSFRRARRGDSTPRVLLGGHEPRSCSNPVQGP